MGPQPDSISLAEGSQDDRRKDLRRESGVRTSGADFDPDFLTLAGSLYQKSPDRLT